MQPLPQAEERTFHLAVVGTHVPVAPEAFIIARHGHADVEQTFDVAFEVCTQIVGRYLAQVMKVGIQTLDVHQVHVGIVKVVDDQVGPEDKGVHRRGIVTHHLTVRLVQHQYGLKLANLVVASEVAQKVDHRHDAWHHRRAVYRMGQLLFEELAAAAIGKHKTQVFEMGCGSIVLSHLLQKGTHCSRVLRNKK